jgi:hypothetical protein
MSKGEGQRDGASRSRDAIANRAPKKYSRLPNTTGQLEDALKRVSFVGVGKGVFCGRSQSKGGQHKSIFRQTTGPRRRSSLRPIRGLCLVICCMCRLADVRSVRAPHSDAVSHTLSISSPPMRYGAGRALAREEAPPVSLHKRQPAGSVAELIHELSDSCREVLHKGRRLLAAAIMACSWGWTCVEIQSLWLLQIMRSARGLLLGTKLRNENRASGSSSWSRLKQMFITNVYCQPIAAVAYMRYAPQQLAAAPVAVTAVITASFRQIYAWMTAKSCSQLYAWMTLSHYPLQVSASFFSSVV